MGELEVIISQSSLKISQEHITGKFREKYSWYQKQKRIWKWQAYILALFEPYEYEFNILWSLAIGSFNNLIALKFDRRLGSSAVETHVTTQSDRAIQNTN